MKSYCIVDGNQCSSNSRFCCPECRKYYNYISSKNVAINYDQYQQPQQPQQQQVPQYYPEDDLVDDLVFEEETYNISNNNYSLESDSNYQYNNFGYQNNQSETSIFSVCSNDSISPETSPLLTPTHDDLKDIKFNSLFETKSIYSRQQESKSHKIQSVGKVNVNSCFDALTTNFNNNKSRYSNNIDIPHHNYQIWVNQNK